MKLRKKHKHEYAAWKVMRADYRNVCDKRWQSFARFLEDMGLVGWKCTIEIIDKSLGYAPGNCRYIHKV